jgi:glycerol kinase
MLCAHCKSSIMQLVSVTVYLGFRTGLPLSTYFSAIKLRWLIDHDEVVRHAHEDDDLMFGTVESWLVYVRLILQLD